MITDTVKGVTQPVYDMVGEYIPFLIGIIAIIILFKLLKKIKSNIQGRKNRTFMSGSTNTWFNWEEYNKRKEEGTVQNDVPQNNKEQFNKKGSLG